MSDFASHLVLNTVTAGAMSLGVLLVWQVWVKPFDARVARELAQHASESPEELE